MLSRQLGFGRSSSGRLPTGPRRPSLRVSRIAAVAADQADAKSMATVEVQKSVPFGRSLKVVGSHPLMGDWDPSNGAGLEWTEGDVWTASLALPPGTWEYKVVVVGGDQPDEWESGDNRIIEVEEMALPATVAEAVEDNESLEIVAEIEEEQVYEQEVVEEESAEEELVQAVAETSEPVMASVMASSVTAEPPMAKDMAVEFSELEEVTEVQSEESQAPPTSNVVPLPVTTAEQARSQPLSNVLEAREWISNWREASAKKTEVTATAEAENLPADHAVSGADSIEGFSEESIEQPYAGSSILPLAGALTVGTAMAAAFVLAAPEGLQVPEQVSKIVPAEVLDAAADAKSKLKTMPVDILDAATVAKSKIEVMNTEVADAASAAASKLQMMNEEVLDAASTAKSKLEVMNSEVFNAAKSKLAMASEPVTSKFTVASKPMTSTELLMKNYDSLNSRSP